MLRGSAPYNATREERFEKWLPEESLPPSYHSTTTSEAEFGAAVDRFCEQFRRYYPNRAPLLLSPMNECGTRKMICTFIRPTVFPYEELYDVASCARFFAHYVCYEPLADMDRLPDVVVSPAVTLNWQIGNCFELSLLLASVLTGGKYNAYVVVGYARKFVCENDYSPREWHDTVGLLDDADSDGESEHIAEIDPEYAALVKERPLLRCTTDPEPPALQKYKTQQLQEPEEKEKEDQMAGTAFRENIILPKRQKLLHSWVLLLPGGRKSQKDAIFIEPSTGDLIPHQEADTFYTGIEAVFNNRNYFVNLAPDAPVSALTVDLSDGTQWEGVVLDIDEDDEHESLHTTASYLGTFPSGPSAPSVTGERLSYSVSLGMRLRAHGTEASAGSQNAPSVTGAAAGLAGVSSLAQVNVPGRFSCPGCASWVKNMTLSRAQYEVRYPGGKKTICYANAEVHLYAPYSMPDLRVMKVWVPDSMYCDKKQLHLLFSHRKDKLRRRSLYPCDPGPQRGAYDKDGGNIRISFRLLKEWYERGRMRDAVVEGLRLFTHRPGIERTMTFYWDARNDGLWRRQEFFYEGRTVRKVKEFYKQRDDRLWYRSATFGRANTTPSPHTSPTVLSSTRYSNSAMGGRSNEDVQRPDPIRMSEKYHRNEQVPPEEDVAKYVFVRTPAEVGGSSGEMWVYFHYRESSIIRPYRMYKKGARGEEYLSAATSEDTLSAGNHMCITVPMPNSSPPSEMDQYNERKRLAWWETLCIGRVRTMMLECNAILETMREAHASLLSSLQQGEEEQLQQTAERELSVLDTLRNRPRETETERARKLAEEALLEESRKDYLAPYIAKLELPRDFNGDYLHIALSPEQARQVRDEALRELKERLIQRGHIMQTQMDAEKEEFNRRQMAYQSNVDAAGLCAAREEEKLAHYCKEATWRMKTLDERLSKHIDHSSEKYARLAQRLTEDPRLAVLYK